MSVPSQEELNQQLAGAVKTNNKDEVEKLLAQGADPNTRDESKLPVLQQAVLNGRQDIVQALFDHGADITARNFANKTALDHAVTSTAMGRKLIGLSNSALLKAVKEKNINMVQKLLQNGAEINTNQNEETPLMLAIATGQTTMVQLLLEDGANINTPVNGKTPLEFANEQQKEYIATPLKNYALLEAAKTGDIEKAKKLLTDGADVNAKNLSGWTPLALAVQHGHTNMVQALIDKGATIDLEARFGTRPGDKSLRELTDNTAIKTMLQKSPQLNNNEQKQFKHYLEILTTLEKNIPSFKVPPKKTDENKRPAILQFKATASAKNKNIDELGMALMRLKAMDVRTKGQLEEFTKKANELITKYKKLDKDAQGFFSRKGRMFEALDTAEQALKKPPKP